MSPAGTARSGRIRLDELLVAQGLASSRAEAARLILAGQVRLPGGVPAKAGRLVPTDTPVERVAAPPFVGRGGEKLAAALDALAVRVEGRVCLDVGASTGGFTDCLLCRGARRVYAVDVGHGQLDPKLRADDRVTAFERVHVGRLTVEDLRARDPAYEPVPLVVADLSFISLRTVAPVLGGPLAAPDADLVLLVKPQFEVGRAAVSRGRGVVRDPALWTGALEGVASALVSAGTGIMGAMASPLTGASGNVEFLLHARKGAPRAQAGEPTALVAAAVAEAASHRSPPGRATPADAAD